MHEKIIKNGFGNFVNKKNTFCSSFVFFSHPTDQSNKTFLYSTHLRLTNRQFSMNYLKIRTKGCKNEFLQNGYIGLTLYLDIY